LDGRKSAALGRHNHLRTVFRGIHFVSPQPEFLGVAILGLFYRLEIFDGDAHQLRIRRAVEPPVSLNAEEKAGVVNVILFRLVLFPLFVKLVPLAPWLGFVVLEDLMFLTIPTGFSISYSFLELIVRFKIRFSRVVGRAVLSLVAVATALAVIVKYQHRLDHGGLQIAGILDGRHPYGLSRIPKECMRECIVNFAKQKLFFGDDGLIDVHYYCPPEQ
jgi:hypothetical protein